MECLNSVLVLGNIKSPHLQKYINFLCNNGVGVDVVCLENEGFFHKNCNIICLGKKHNFIFNYIKFCFLSFFHNYQIINPHFVSSFGILCLFLRGKNLVLNFWGSDILIVPKKSQLKQFLIKILLKKCKYCVTSTDESINEIKKLNQNVKIVKAGFGIDLKKYNFRQRKINNDCIQFLTNRWHKQIYNPMIILESFLMLEKLGYNFVLHVAAGGELTHIMQKFVKQHNLTKKILFLGELSENQMLSQYENCDVYVNMSASDTEAISVKEAMACGAYVISSNINAMREFMFKDNLVNLNAKDLFEKLCLLFDNKYIDNTKHYRDFVVQNCGDNKNLKIMFDNLKALKK